MSAAHSLLRLQLADTSLPRYIPATVEMSMHTPALTRITIIASTMPAETKPAPASPLSPVDVFAAAQELESKLHALETRCCEAERVGEELRKRRSELQHVLEVFETIEDTERQTTKALHAELAKAREEMGDVERALGYTFDFRFESGVASGMTAGQ